MQNYTNKQNTLNMKKELLTLVAGSAMFASFANAEIVLTDDLSAYGYIDMAYATSDDASSYEGSVAEFELGFAFTPADSQWSAVTELSFDNNSGDFDAAKGTVNNSAEFETVTITYAYSDALSFTAGNMLTYQGFETFDATGLYQNSYQGILSTDNGVVYSAGYAFGASVDYVTDMYSVGFWAGEGDGDEGSFEYFAKFTGVENLTVVAVLADDGVYDSHNLWASYEIDAFTFAAEYYKTDYTGTADDTETYMALAYYAMGDAGLTLRYTTGEHKGDDFEKITFSPSYAFSDSVFGLLEYSYADVKDQDTESSYLAAELIFSF